MTAVPPAISQVVQDLVCPSPQVWTREHPHSVIPTGADHRESDDLRSGGTLCLALRTNYSTQAKTRLECAIRLPLLKMTNRFWVAQRFTAAVTALSLKYGFSR